MERSGTGTAIVPPRPPFTGKGRIKGRRIKKKKEMKSPLGLFWSSTLCIFTSAFLPNRSGRRQMADDVTSSLTFGINEYCEWIFFFFFELL